MRGKVTESSLPAPPTLIQPPGGYGGGAGAGGVFLTTLTLPLAWGLSRPLTEECKALRLHTL